MKSFSKQQILDLPKQRDLPAPVFLRAAWYFIVHTIIYASCLLGADIFSTHIISESWRAYTACLGSDAYLEIDPRLKLPLASGQELPPKFRIFIYFSSQGQEQGVYQRRTLGQLLSQWFQRRSEDNRLSQLTECQPDPFIKEWVRHMPSYRISKNIETKNIKESGEGGGLVSGP